MFSVDLSATQACILFTKYLVTHALQMEWKENKYT